MTADEWAAEEYRQQRKRKARRAPGKVATLVLAVACFRVAKAVVERLVR